MSVTDDEQHRGIGWGDVRWARTSEKPLSLRCGAYRAGLAQRGNTALSYRTCQDHCGTTAGFRYEVDGTDFSAAPMALSLGVAIRLTECLRWS